MRIDLRERTRTRSHGVKNLAQTVTSIVKYLFITKYTNTDTVQGVKYILIQYNRKDHTNAEHTLWKTKQQLSLPSLTKGLWTINIQ